MASAGEDKGPDFYEVLGLKKECTSSELRNAYKRLAMRWHPDRCSASGNPKFVEEAKKKFQAIQEAYSVLSDDNKRFLYDVGVYDDDDDENGMGEFLNEMADMMSQTKPSDNGEESFEQLKQLFNEMFNGDADAFGSSSATFSNPPSSSFASCCESSSSNNKMTSVEMNLGKGMSSDFDPQFQSFCFGVTGRPQNQRIGNVVTGGTPGGQGDRSKNTGKKIYPPRANYPYELNSTNWKRRKK